MLKSNIQRIAFLTISLILCSNNIFTQDYDSLFSRNFYGAYIHFNYNLHDASFAKLPGIPNCCPNFENGNGNGFSLGLLTQ